jgi:hypothetical protein
LESVSKGTRLYYEWFADPLEVSFLGSNLFLSFFVTFWSSSCIIDLSTSNTSYIDYLFALENYLCTMRYMLYLCMLALSNGPLFNKNVMH